MSREEFRNFVKTVEHNFLIKEKKFIASNTIGYVMPPERSVDIDNTIDWMWAEFLMIRTKIPSN